MKAVKSNSKTKRKRVVKRNIKDSVFTDLFKIKKYSLELYKSLHPEDKDVTERDLKIYTNKPVLVNDLYNDFAMSVKDKIIFLMEEQSTWSINILPRDLLYLAWTYKKIFDKEKTNLYGSKKVHMPIPELYVLYTGRKKIKEKVLSLNKEYFNNKAPIDLKVKVIVNAKKNSILYQYIEFSKITDSLIQQHGYKKATAEKIVNSCIKKNILKEYLNDRKKEVVDIMGILFDQDIITRNYENEIFEEGKAEGKAEGRAEGMQQGMEQGELEAFVKIYKKGMIKANDAARMLNITVAKFLELAKEK